MKGETLTVLRRVQTGLDEGNNPVYEDVAEEVPNVLVGPPGGENSTDSNRPDGVIVDATLFFPAPSKAVRSEGLKSASGMIRLLSKWSENPFPVNGGMTTTDWNMAVDVTRSQG